MVIPLEPQTPVLPAPTAEEASRDMAAEVPMPELLPSPASPRRLLHRSEGFLVPALVLFALGNGLAYALPNLAFAKPLIGLPLIVMLSGLVFFAVRPPQNRWAIRLNLWLILLIAGALHYQCRQFTPPADDVSRFAPLDRAEVGAMVEVPETRNRMVVRVKTVNGKPATGLLQVSLGAQSDESLDSPRAGTRLLLSGDLRSPFTSRIPGAFDEAKYLATQHIGATMRRPVRLIAFEESNEARYVLQRLTDDMKERVAATFNHALPAPHGAVLGGIVLGERAIPLDRDTRQSFIQTGLVHLLAASGLNVGIIAGAVLALMAWLKTPLRLRLVVAMAAVGIYSMLTGMPPSIQRAATMLGLALFLKLLDRELSATFLLCLVAVALILWNPENIGNIGFQFSVLTTFGLVTMVPPLQERLGYYITRWLAGLMLVPAVAQLWVWPLSVYYFNQFPVHSVPLNMAAVAMVAPLTVIGFSAGLVSLLFQPLAEWMSWLAYPFLTSLLWLVQAGNAMDWALWQLASPPGWMILLLYTQWLVLLALLYRFKSWATSRKVMLALLPLGLMLAGSTLDKLQSLPETTVDLLPLSYRSQAYLIRPGGTQTQLLLVPEGLRYYEGRALADYLRHRSLTHLKGVVLLPSAPAHEAEAGSGRVDDSGLKAALKRVRVDTLYGDTDEPEKSRKPWGQIMSRQAMPMTGLNLRLSGLHLNSEGRRFRLIQGNRCLLQLDTQYASQAEGCAVQAVRSEQETRLYADAFEPEAQRPYRLRLRNSGTLSVY